jgi:hypothetical protein
MSGTSRSSRVQPIGVEEVSRRSCSSGARTESATQPSSRKKEWEKQVSGPAGDQRQEQQRGHQDDVDPAPGRHRTLGRLGRLLDGPARRQHDAHGLILPPLAGFTEFVGFDELAGLRENGRRLPEDHR